MLQKIIVPHLATKPVRELKTVSRSALNPLHPRQTQSPSASRRERKMKMA